MTCTTCGTQLAAGVTLCSTCGSPQRAPARASADPLTPAPPGADAWAGTSSGTSPVAPPARGPLGKAGVLGISLVAVLGLGATAYNQHHESSDKSSTYLETPPATYTPAPAYTYTPAPVAAQDLSAELGAGTWSATSHQDGGYTYSSALDIGTVHPAAAGLGVGNAISGVCTFDTQTDALVPYRLTATNLTSGFSSKVAAHLSLQGVTAEATYGDSGATCQESEFGVKALNPLTANQSTTLYGFFVIPRYYTPDHPQGDPAVLDEVHVGFTSTSNDVGTITVDRVDGPGVQSGYGSFTFSLSPAG